MKISNLFVSIAGVDKDKLNVCTKMDKFWISHIGLMLCCTFIVLFGITYLSFDYLGNIKVTFDEANSKLVIGEVHRNAWTVLLGVLIATVIGGIIFLFDRAIFLSDWFYQKSYIDFITEKDKKQSAIEASVYFFSIMAIFTILQLNYDAITAKPVGYKKITVVVFLILLIFSITWFALSQVRIYATEYQGPNVSVPEVTVFKKIARIFLRLGISVCVAYALSIFLELRLYEETILDVVRKEHISNNKKLYEDFEKQAKAVTQKITDKDKALAELNKKLTQVSSGDEVDIRDLTKQINQGNSDLNNARTKELQQLDEQKKVALKALNDKRTMLENKRDTLVQELLLVEDRLKATIEGDSLNKYPDIKKKPGCGPQCRTIQKTVARLKDEKKYQEKLIKEENTKISNLIKTYETREAEIQKNYNTQQNMVKFNNEKLIEIKLNAHKQKTLEREDKIKFIKEKIKLTKKDLEKLKKEQPKEIKRLKDKVESSPNYKPIQAGPLGRLKALETVRQDKATGAVITRFSLWVKLFLIFLEVIPVITKMFFSPPSVYATLVQKETFLKTAKIKLDIERENYREKFMEVHSYHIVLDEKLKLIVEQQVNRFKKALEEELLKRKEEEELYGDKMNAFDRAKSFGKGAYNTPNKNQENTP
ncbi:MAG: DUF4407 domain-containing protein [Pasteurella sp.]|nr:DUF4407 domain-containing protein [Pasteurella sp.]